MIQIITVEQLRMLKNEGFDGCFFHRKNENGEIEIKPLMKYISHINQIIGK